MAENKANPEMRLAAQKAKPPEQFSPTLSLFDTSMVVAGSMIGSGIFIVSADIARRVHSPASLLALWPVSGVMTVMGALAYGELASMMPQAGGQYVYLRQAYASRCAALSGNPERYDSRGCSRFCAILRSLLAGARQPLADGRQFCRLWAKTTGDGRNFYSYRSQPSRYRHRSRSAERLHRRQNFIAVVHHCNCSSR